MASLQQLKTRIRSTKNTSKLTKAMQTVAAIRYRKNQSAAGLAKKYEESVAEIYETILHHSKECEHSTFFRERVNGKVLMVIISPSRGFCGGLHRGVTAKSYAYLRGQGVEPTDENVCEIITVNKTGLKQVSLLGGELQAAFADMSKNPDHIEALAISEYIYQQYKNNDKFSKVYITYVSSSTNTVATNQVLPIISDEPDDEEHDDLAFDSSRGGILNELVHQYLHSEVFSFLLQTLTVEERMRMMAMNQATENAKKLSDKLQLSYFRQRQAKITQEMSEIASNLG